MNYAIICGSYCRIMGFCDILIQTKGYSCFDISFSHSGFSTIMAKRLSRTDPTSFSNPDEVVITHIDLDLKIDFEKQTLAGLVNLSVTRVKPDADVVVSVLQCSLSECSIYCWMFTVKSISFV